MYFFFFKCQLFGARAVPNPPRRLEITSKHERSKNKPWALPEKVAISTWYYQAAGKAQRPENVAVLPEVLNARPTSTRGRRLRGAAPLRRARAGRLGTAGKAPGLPGPGGPLLTSSRNSWEETAEASGRWSYTLRTGF